MNKWLILIVMAAGTLCAAMFLAPWFHSAPVPVQLRLDAPANAAMRISWGPGAKDSLPLVCYTKPDGSATNLWLAELPPRPSYHLAVIFESLVKRAVLREIRLIDVRRPDVPVYERKSDTSSPWFEADNVNVTRGDHSFLLTPAAGGRIVIPDTIRLSHGSGFLTVMALWGGLLAIFILAVAMIWPLFRFKGVSMAVSEAAGGTRALWIAFGIATILHVLLVTVAPIVLAGGDTGMYLQKGISLAQHGSYEPGGYEYELNRLPGYPLVLAGIFKVFGYGLSCVGLVQGLMYCVAVLVLAMSLRTWIRPGIGAAAVFLAILSPAQVWASRTVLSESSFGTFSLLAMAALFTHVRTTGVKSILWLILFGVLATFAIFIRPNGIALYVAFVPVCVPRILGLVAGGRSMRQRLGRMFCFSLPYAATVVIALAAILAWSDRNYHRRGYFAATDMTGVTLVCGLTASGTFDIDCLANTELYDQYLTHKYQQGYYYPGYNLRHDLYMQISQNQTKLDDTTVAKLDGSLRALAARSKRYSSWRMNTIGLLRSAWWAAIWPDVEAYSRESIRLDYVTFENNAAAARGARFPTVGYIRETFLPSISRQLIYDERNPNAFYSLYSWFGNLYYNGWYVVWSGLGLAAAIYVLWRRHAGLAMPAFVFMANIILNVYLLNVFSRYIHILDGLIFFQCALGLSLFLNNRKTAAKEFGKV